ncbi:MAG: lysozyme inhibitor LprI family protein [Candidatus Sphingomonas phytovorans]|nr:lysozyme inhibitor LprI family protein [Sphingomonas sp.]WEJ98261.1 MAG: lysozyme inhibitor LprI family protein [Sphingomonas sp.]
MIQRFTSRFRIACYNSILASLCVVLPIPSSAFGRSQADTGGKAVESAYERCSSAARAVMPKIFDCQRAELDRVDNALNRTYQQLRRTLPPTRFRKLRIEERAWLKRLDKTCTKEAGGSDALGQDSQFFWLGCLIRETDTRLSKLEALLPGRRPR